MSNTPYTPLNDRQPIPRSQRERLTSGLFTTAVICGADAVIGFLIAWSSHDPRWSMFGTVLASAGTGLLPGTLLVRAIVLALYDVGDQITTATQQAASTRLMPRPDEPGH
ncbi:hypothetical protein [Streptomyces sp. NPDC101150]|uniref:hypothetical protein n=1 Tax=Streptomyces sp. NPDC101150 TaxID=3366114 RepID=UPI0037FB7B07